MCQLHSNAVPCYLPYILSNQGHHACVPLRELRWVTCLGRTADCAVLGLKAKCLSRDRMPLQVIEMLSSVQPPKKPCIHIAKVAFTN